MNRLSSDFNRVILILSMALASIGVSAEECRPSKWGPDDEIGAANYITPDQILMASRLVKSGQSHPLGIVIDTETPAYPPRSTSLQVVTPGQHNGRKLIGEFGWDVVYNDDLAQLWFGTGSQLDGLGHMGESGVYYNCNKAEDFVHITGLKKLGTHQVPPLIGRGIWPGTSAFLPWREVSPSARGISRLLPGTRALISDREMSFFFIPAGPTGSSSQSQTYGCQWNLASPMRQQDTWPH
jgi:hypothetical protein